MTGCFKLDYSLYSLLLLTRNYRTEFPWATVVANTGLGYMGAGRFANYAMQLHSTNAFLYNLWHQAGAGNTASCTRFMETYAAMAERAGTEDFKEIRFNQVLRLLQEKQQ